MSEFRVPAGEILARTKLIQREMQKREIGGILVSQRIDLFYFTGTAQNGYLYIPAAGEPLLLIKKYLPRAFWGVIASMYVGNAMLLVLNLPLIGLWVRLLRVPYWVLAPLILLFCLVGAYSLDGYIYDALVVIIIGIIGYLMRKFDYEAAPFVLAFILGPMFETAFRQSLLYSHGDLLIFFKRPIPAVFIALSIAAIASNLIGLGKKTIKEAGDKTPFGDISTTGTLLAVAAVFLFLSSHYRFGNLRNPGVGFFPVVLSFILGLLALGHLSRPAFGKTRAQEKAKNPWLGLQWSKTIIVMVSLVLYVALFDAAGFLLATLILMEFLFVFGNHQQWKLGTMGALLSSGLSYTIFKSLLGIQLPAGVLERLLGLA